MFLTARYTYTFFFNYIPSFSLWYSGYCERNGRKFINPMNSVYINFLWWCDGTMNHIPCDNRYPMTTVDMLKRGFFFWFLDIFNSNAAIDRQKCPTMPKILSILIKNEIAVWKFIIFHVLCSMKFNNVMHGFKVKHE